MNFATEIRLSDLSDAVVRLRPEGEAWIGIAQLLGLEVAARRAVPEQPRASTPIVPPAKEQRAGLFGSASTFPLPLPRESRDAAEPIPISAALLNGSALDISGPRAAFATPPPSPLIPPRELRAFVYATVAQLVPSATVDLEKLTGQLARLRMPRTLPRKMRRGLRRGVALVTDYGDGMQPFRSDAAQFARGLRQIAASHQYKQYSVVGSPADPLDGDIDRLPKTAPVPGAVVAILTDAGIARPWSMHRAQPAEWMGWAKRLTRAGYRVVAVVPYGPSRWPAGARRSMHCTYWHPAKRVAGSGPHLVRALCRRLSLAGRVDPVLLREARRYFFPHIEAGLEADCIFSRYVAIANPHVVVFRDDALRELREELAADPAELEETRRFLQKHRGSPERTDELLSFEEDLVYSALRGTPQDQAAVHKGLAGTLRALVSREEEHDLARWAVSFVREAPAWVQELEVSVVLSEVSRRRVAGRPVQVYLSRSTSPESRQGYRVHIGPDGFTRMGALRNDRIQAIRNVLVGLRGFALVPSDTCYSLATRPTDTEMARRVNRILGRKEEPISLAFDERRRIAEWVDVTSTADRLIEALTPGPLTVVCRVREGVEGRIAVEVLAAPDRTIGCRIPDSVERQLVTACDYPLTTVAVRTLDEEKRVVTDFEEARRIVEQGIASLGEPVALATVEYGRPFESAHSTVVRTPGRSGEAYEILRQGEISREQIVEKAATPTRRELESEPRFVGVRELAARILTDVRATDRERSVANLFLSALAGATPDAVAVFTAELESIWKDIEHPSRRRPI
ncbi:MAG TPA: Sua5/YciO/YrdC/YwlC family protein [Thermoanaerobaculia bacterium]|nr:Sua5/YciO/YrdC/YwlC family protein [Thermoanaerobaculia bacterium]